MHSNYFNTEVMERHAALLRSLNTEAYSFAGGHYGWPALPPYSSVCSALFIDALKKQLGGTTTIFLDDIGASEACDKSVCSAPSFLKHSSDKAVPPPLEPIHAIADLAGRLENGTITFGELLTFGLPENILVPHLTIEVNLLALERFFYFNHRENFRPLLMTYNSKRHFDNLILEKSMNNSSSRNLHKIVKNMRNASLEVLSNGSTREYYAISRYNRKSDRILLRTESTDTDDYKASNFCPVLLAHFFFKMFRANKDKAASHTVNYVIPCYDRGRLYEGVQTFYALYGADIQYWFGSKKINIISTILLDSMVLSDLFEISEEYGMKYVVRGC
ncbi:MAG: hypothetical protein ACOYL3_15580 [Desulfuromonadaceae bacterium]